MFWVLFYKIKGGQILLSGIQVFYCCCTFRQPWHYQLIDKCLNNEFRSEFRDWFFHKLYLKPKFWMESIIQTIADEVIMTRLSKHSKFTILNLILNKIYGPKTWLWRNNSEFWVPDPEFNYNLESIVQKFADEVIITIHYLYR